MIRASFSGTIGAIALSASNAASEIVGNDADWDVNGHVELEPELRLRMHSDDWRWRDADHYRWREHEDRGYWRDGSWIEIK